jgi:3-oxoacyl-[acyl-carrier protein] reductase
MAYAASKAALMNLTTNLARGLAPEVRVNAVAPGMIRTPWTIRFGQEWEDRSVEMTCLKRVGTPDDIAEVILFLLAGAGYVTGQTIRADGGMG